MNSDEYRLMTLNTGNLHRPLLRLSIANRVVGKRQRVVLEYVLFTLIRISIVKWEMFNMVVLAISFLIKLQIHFYYRFLTAKAMLFANFNKTSVQKKFSV